MLSGSCPTANSIGSCTASSTIGVEGVRERIFEYSGSNKTPAAYQAECAKDHGVYSAPDGSSTIGDAGVASGSGCGSTAPTGSGGATSSGSGVAFSIATSVNGEVLECTNYVGTVTQAQLNSVLALGAVTTACPRANAACACTMPNGGTFGTTATLVYYNTATAGSQASFCQQLGTDCPRQGGTFSATYTPP
jgi:hypothetical protein